MENYYNCIYCCTNKINGKRYIGQAKDFNKRQRQHINSSYNKNQTYDYNLPFHRAIRKYGIENFSFEILKENLKTQCLLNFYEYYYIDKFNTLAKNQKGYNISNGGSNGNSFAGKSKEEMDEIKKKISENHFDVSGENHPMYGVHRYGSESPMYGKHHTKETKTKISEKLSGENHPFYGKKRPEHSERMKGKNSPNLGNLIERWDKQGNLIDIKYNFEFVQMGFHSSHIGACCKGKQKTHKGFIFKYHEKDD